MDINDFKIIEDTDIQTINLDLDLGTSNNDSLGIELLADPKKTAKTDGNADIAPSPKREEFNLFNDNDIKDLKIDNNPIIDFDKEQNDMNNILYKSCLSHKKILDF